MEGSGNDFKNSNFRRSSTQFSNAKEHLLLSGFSVSGLSGIENYDFSFSSQKLILLGNGNTGKSTYLSLDYFNFIANLLMSTKTS